MADDKRRNDNDNGASAPDKGGLRRHRPRYRYRRGEYPIDRRAPARRRCMRRPDTRKVGRVDIRRDGSISLSYVPTSRCDESTDVTRGRLFGDAGIRPIRWKRYRYGCEDFVQILTTIER